MATALEVKQRIEASIPGAVAEVESPDDVHFSARVVSPAFIGKSRLQQHRMVYDVFGGGELGGAIHALSLKTEVPRP
jgi:stress-induced morphogen